MNNNNKNKLRDHCESHASAIRYMYKHIRFRMKYELNTKLKANEKKKNIWNIDICETFCSFLLLDRKK